MGNRDDIQAQNIPVQINYDDPDVIRKLIDSHKQILSKINEIDDRVLELENLNQF